MGAGRVFENHCSRSGEAYPFFGVQMNVKSETAGAKQPAMQEAEEKRELFPKGLRLPSGCRACCRH